MGGELGDQDRHPVAERALLLLRAHRHRHADDRRDRRQRVALLEPGPHRARAGGHHHVVEGDAVRALDRLELGQRERLPHYGAIGRDAAVERRARRQRGRCLHHHPLLHRPAHHRLVDGRRRVPPARQRPADDRREAPPAHQQASLGVEEGQRAPSHAERGARQQLGTVRDTVRHPVVVDLGGGHLRRPIEQDPGHVHAGRAVDRGVVEEQDHRHPAAFQAMDEMDVPQRPAPVERLARQARRELGEPAVVPGRRQRHLREVVVEIEVGILDPVRLAEPQRDLDEPSTRQRQQVQALFDDRAQRLHRQLRALGLEHHDVHEMLERRVGLPGEPRIGHGQLLHHAHLSALQRATSAGTSISRLRILPVGPFGSSSTNQTLRGYL